MVEKMRAYAPRRYENADRIPGVAYELGRHDQAIVDVPVMKELFALAVSPSSFSEAQRQAILDRAKDQIDTGIRQIGDS